MRLTTLLITLMLASFISTLSAQNVPSYIPSNGLVGWWPFNGNADDESGNGNHGTIHGASLINDRYSFPNSALVFDGIDDYVIVPNSPSLNFGTSNSFTVSFYYEPSDRVTNPNGYNGIIGKSWPSNSTPPRGWQIGRNNSVFMFESRSGDNLSNEFENPLCLNYELSTVIFSQNDLYTYIIDKETNQVHLFKNSNLVYSYNCPDLQLNMDNTSPLLFAVDRENSFFTSGVIDDVAIWNRALTPQEITDLYNGGVVDCVNDLTISPQLIEADLGSTATLTATSTQQNQTITWQSDLGQGFQTLNDYGQYSGTSTATLTIQDIQLANHQQPIRAISTYGDCVDTSDVVIIQVIDTCINYATIYDTVTVQVFDTMLVTLTIYDTILTTVTDTLVINAMITGLNPPLNQNTIKVYPNPTSTHITIDYGNFSQMMGYQLRIVNTIGQVVFQTNITQSSDFLNLSTWGGTGIYFLHLIDPMGNTIDTRKIVLQ
jgi:hypothetical protein